MMNFAHFAPALALPEADGSIDADDRAMFLGLYGGIALAGPTTGILPGRITVMNQPTNLIKITGFILALLNS